MTGFAADWLALREAADERARAAPLLDALELAAWRTDPLRIVDLGAGTGANFRYLAPRLGGRQRWLLVDDDEALLHRSGARELRDPGADRDGGRKRDNERSPPTGRDRCAERDDSPPLGIPEAAAHRGPRATQSLIELKVALVDLASSFETLALPRRALVTASALLDLVSADWLRSLAARCADAEAAVLFALTYDGRIEATPRHADDELVRALVNRHQTGDKGFGPALGPAAATTAIDAFVSRGYAMKSARSDWRLDPLQSDLQRALIEGWATAAVETAPAHAARIERWCAERLGHVDAGRSTIVVGHLDVAGRPDSHRASGS